MDRMHGTHTGTDYAVDIDHGMGAVEGGGGGDDYDNGGNGDRDWRLGPIQLCMALPSNGTHFAYCHISNNQSDVVSRPL